jgi:NAD/NADP transhydrogenase alpha subunit
VLAVEYEVDPIDGVISTCYRLIGSFERAIGDKQALQAISQETLARALREIANKAFTVGWNSQNLTSIQRAQILDVLLSVANLAEYSFQHSL